jgi:alpha-ketoglutarate-dependent taurine dioxygenase
LYQFEKTKPFFIPLCGTAVATNVFSLCIQQVWQVGDVVMWDNRCVMHRRDAFDNSARRVMHRTTVAGDGPTA